MKTNNIQTAQNSEHKIYEIVEYILNNYKTIKSIDSLVELSGLEKKYFITLFRKLTFETPHALLNKLRLIEGKKLLETTNLSVVQIAKEVGYTSANTFTKLFTIKMGVSPSIYRKGII